MIMTKTDIHLHRNVAIARIRKALRQRSGKAWSVTGGRGTAWGWIRVSAPPAREFNGSMTVADRDELAKLLGLESVHCQGVSIPSGGKFREEYVDRAEGREPTVRGEIYWD